MAALVKNGIHVPIHRHTTLEAPMNARLLPLVFALVLTGCDLDTLLADPKTLQKEADAKAMGGACRHGMRSIEDCYAMNEKASKAAIFAGWKEMDSYMRDNKIEGIESKGVKAPAPTASAPSADDKTSHDTPAAEDKKAAHTEPKAKAHHAAATH